MNGPLSELRSRSSAKAFWFAALTLSAVFAFSLPARAAVELIDGIPVAVVSSTVPTAPTAVSIVPSVTSAFNPSDYGITAAYAMTPKSRRELYAWNAEQSWPIASLTKLVSALAWKDKALPMKKVVKLLKQDEVGGGRLRVAVGTKVYFEDLWYSSITASANNAAVALARLSGLTAKQMTALMTKEAKLAGAKNATFADASGMDANNTASAREMALIADRAFSVRAIQKAASTTGYVVRVIGKKITKHLIWTTNRLLRYDPDVWVIAGKTGYLDESRHNLVVWMRPVGVDGKPETGKDVLIVVYGAPTSDKMFAAAKALAQSLWKSDAFTLATAAPKGAK